MTMRGRCGSGEAGSPVRTCPRHPGWPLTPFLQFHSPWPGAGVFFDRAAPSYYLLGSVGSTVFATSAATATVFCTLASITFSTSGAAASFFEVPAATAA